MKGTISSRLRELLRRSRENEALRAEVESLRAELAAEKAARTADIAETRRSCEHAWSFENQQLTQRAEDAEEKLAAEKAAHRESIFDHADTEHLRQATAAWARRWKRAAKHHSGLRAGFVEISAGLRSAEVDERERLENLACAAAFHAGMLDAECDRLAGYP